jgi:hypothetical protein
LDREVDHGEKGKVEEEIHKEGSRPGAQEEKNDEVVEESGAEEEGQEGCAKAQEGRAETQGCCSKAQGCCSEARRAEACGQSDAGASTSTRSVAGAVMDAAVGVRFRRFWRRRYRLALARSLTRRLAIEPAPRQTRWNRGASGRIA